jgi:hypothetical protein
MNEVILAGERYLRVDLVAAWYEVEVAWIEQAQEWGLIARLRRHESALWIPVDELDHLARTVALHRHYALEIEAIAGWLNQPPSP